MHIWRFLFSSIFYSEVQQIFACGLLQYFWPCSLIIFPLEILKSNHTEVNQKLNKFTGISVTIWPPLKCKTYYTLFINITKNE